MIDLQSVLWDMNIAHADIVMMIYLRCIIQP